MRLDWLGVEGGVKASLCGHDEFVQLCSLGRRE